MSKREFFKQSRRENFDDSGSIRLTEVEQNAYRNVITFEAVDLAAPRYFNFKTLPENTHYGYATYFEGDSVTKVEPIKFPLYRLSDSRNEMLWHFYQTQEVVNLIQGFNEAIANAVVEQLKDTAPNLIRFLIELTEPTTGPADRIWEWVISLVSDDTQPPPAEPFIPLPIDTPHPTVIKFKADVPMRFSLRLDSWFLANPVVYIVGSVVDTDEPTEDEGEYPDRDGTGNPDGGTYGDGSESPLPLDSDPRDTPEGSFEFEPGVAYSTEYRVSGTVLGNQGDDEPYTNVLTIAQILPSGATVDASDSFLVNENGKTYYSGLVIRNSVGLDQTRIFVGVGFPKGGHTLTIIRYFETNP